MKFDVIHQFQDMMDVYKKQSVFMCDRIFLVVTGALLMPGVFQAHEHSRPKTVAGEPRFAAAAPRKKIENPCRMTLELKDGESGEEMVGLIRIADLSGKYLALPELIDRSIGLRGKSRPLGWHVLTGKTELDLPRASLKLEALCGLETELATQSLDLRGKNTATHSIELKRIFDAKQRGLVSGNTHLHLMNLNRLEADHYLQTVPRGDGLDLVFVSYLERAEVDKTYVSNGYSRDDLDGLSSKTLKFGDGEEYRHNTGGGGEGYGHVMFLDLKKRILPASLGPGITKTGTDDIPLRPGIVNAKSQGATVIWCHNTFGFEDIPNWAEGLVDAQNIFDGGTHGGYADTFYRYLNIGYRVPFSTGTDWFIYDFSRVYVPLADNDVSAESWLKVLASGQSVITNSALLGLEVSGEKPGGTVRLDEAGKVIVQGTARGRVDFGGLQLIQNGDVIAEIKSVGKGGHFEATLNKELALGESAWLALRISPDAETRNEMGKPLFAHTSPVYVQIDGKSVFKQEIAQGLIDEIVENISAIEKAGKFKNDEGKELVLGIYREGIRKLEQRIQDLSQK